MDNLSLICILDKITKLSSLVRYFTSTMVALVTTTLCSPPLMTTSHGNLWQLRWPTPMINFGTTNNHLQPMKVFKIMGRYQFISLKSYINNCINLNAKLLQVYQFKSSLDFIRLISCKTIIWINQTSKFSRVNQFKLFNLWKLIIRAIILKCA